MPRTKRRNVKLLLVGKTGSGKSSTGNSILKGDFFHSGFFSTSSVTKEVKTCSAFHSGRSFNVVDSPGVFDNDNNHMEEEQYKTLIVKSMEEAISTNPDGFSAIILVCKFGDRFTNESKDTVRILKAVFGDTFLETFGIVVMTFGDLFHSDETLNCSFEEWCDRQTKDFHDLLVECNKRIVLFDNMAKDDEIKSAQLSRLLEIIDSLNVDGERYTAEHFQLAQETRQILMSELTGPDKINEIELRLINQKLTAITSNETETRLNQLGRLQIRAINLIQPIQTEEHSTEFSGNYLETALQLQRYIEKEITKASYPTPENNWSVENVLVVAAVAIGAIVVSFFALK